MWSVHGYSSWLVFPSEITTESNSEGNRSSVMEDVYYGRVARHRTWCSRRHGGHRPPYGMCCSSVFYEYSETEEQESAMSKFLKRMRLKRWTAKMEACIKT